MTQLTKPERIQSILLSDALKTQSTTRAHYMPQEKDSWLDPQRFFQQFPSLYVLIKAILTPTMTLHCWTTEVPDPATHIVLNLGAGATQLHPAMINTDFVAFAHIDIVADFSAPLPIRSDSVDAVVSISVFEHLAKPQFVAAEVWRILKPGGIFYLAVPFLYPFHAAPYDFTRWSLPGVRLLLGESFEIVRSGARGGPMGVVILALAHTLAQLLSFGSVRLYSIVNFAGLGLLAPLKLLDLGLAHLPFNSTLCPGLFVTAKKITRPHFPE